MRFFVAHKTTTYLTVVTAYLALVLSGELSDIAVGLSFLGVAGSWFWDRPGESQARWWTFVSVAVFAYSIVAVFLGQDVLLVGAQFLLYLLVAKLFNRRAPKDYQQIYILTFLMLVAGTVLNTGFSFGIFFLGYVIASTWALILFHLRREMESNFLLKHAESGNSERVPVSRILNSRRIVGQSFFVGTSALSIAIFLASSALFLLIPRIGFGLFFQKSRAPVNMTGFSDGVQLGGHGVIKTDDTVVMRVKVDPEYAGRKAPYIHWRGVAFDRYEQGNWRRSRFAPHTRRDVTQPEDGVTRHRIRYKDSSSSLDKAIRQEIYLEPLGYDVLFAAAMPVAFDLETKWRQTPRKARNDEMRYAHSAGIKYVVYSDLDGPPTDRLKKAKWGYPDNFRPYLNMPDEIPARVRDLAKEVTRGKSSPYEKAAAIESWLKENLGYTLQMEEPGAGVDPVNFFLFQRRKGHCEYFSSAMAIMARAVGLPSRNVNGFLGGEWNEYNEYIAVRAGDAHSWVEIFFDDVGWVTFDPTPSGTVDQMGRGGLGLLDRSRRMIDTLRFKWFKWVIEYDLYRQMSLFRNLGNKLRGGGSSVKSAIAAGKSWVKEHKKSFALIATIAGGIFVVVFLVVRRRKLAESLLGGSRVKKRRRSAVALLYASVLGRLRKLGHPRNPSTTPREYAAELRQKKIPGAVPFAKLTEIYYEAEYGHEPSGSNLDAAKRAKLAIDEALRGAASLRRG